MTPEHGLASMVEEGGPYSTYNATETQQAELATPEETVVQYDLDVYGASPGDISFIELLQDYGALDECQAPGSPSTALYWPEVSQNTSETNDQGACASRSLIAQPPTLQQQSASSQPSLGRLGQHPAGASLKPARLAALRQQIFQEIPHILDALLSSQRTRCTHQRQMASTRGSATRCGAGWLPRNYAQNLE